MLLIKELNKDKVGDKITLAGWLRTKRDSKGGFSFLEINDGSTFTGIQVVADNNLDNYSDIKLLHTGASLKVSGKLVESPGAKQAYELQADNVVIYGNTDQSYLLQKGRINFETLRESAHLRCRTNSIGAVMRVRNILSKATHDFFQSRHFLNLHTPIITASDCEGAGEMFQVTTLDLDKLPKTDLD